MFTIHKYRLDVIDEQFILMPSTAEVLTVQVQNNVLCIWAKHSSKVPREHYNRLRRFVIVGTGHEFTDDGLTYLGTVQMNGFVWHVFEAA